MVKQGAYTYIWVDAVGLWLRLYATSWKAGGSKPDYVFEILKLTSSLRLD
jgi:hypothetical protein